MKKPTFRQILQNYYDIMIVGNIFIYSQWIDWLYNVFRIIFCEQGFALLERSLHTWKKTNYYPTFLCSRLHKLKSLSIIFHNCTHQFQNKLNLVNSVPETIFLDENGNRIGNSYMGSRSYEQWCEIIDGLLAELDK